MEKFYSEDNIFAKEDRPSPWLARIINVTWTLKRQFSEQFHLASA